MALSIFSLYPNYFDSFRHPNILLETKIAPFWGFQNILYHFEKKILLTYPLHLVCEILFNGIYWFHFIITSFHFVPYFLLFLTSNCFVFEIVPSNFPRFHSLFVWVLPHTCSMRFKSLFSFSSFFCLPLIDFLPIHAFNTIETIFVMLKC